MLRSHLALALALCLALPACHFDFPERVTMGPEVRIQKPAPKDLGQIRGRVVDQKDGARPVPLAFIKVGDISTFAGHPTEERLEDEVDNQRQISVMHQFPGGAEPELAERRLRKYFIDSPDPFDRKYVYLRPGEFYLEGLPPGEATVRVSSGPHDAERAVTVVAGQDATLAPIAVKVYEPPVPNPRVLVQENLKSLSFIMMKVARPEGGPVSLSFEPEEPHAVFGLRPLSGSAGFTIHKVSLAYSWIEDKELHRTDPVEVAIEPVAVVPTQGPPTEVRVPLPTAPLEMLAERASHRSIWVVMNLLDAQGRLALDRRLVPLEAIDQIQIR